MREGGRGGGGGRLCADCRPPLALGAHQLPGSGETTPTMPARNQPCVRFDHEMPKKLAHRAGHFGDVGPSRSGTVQHPLCQIFRRGIRGGGGGASRAASPAHSRAGGPVDVLFLYGALDSQPFFPSHVASGRCVLSAAAAGAPAGVVSAFAEPSGWRTGGCAGAPAPPHPPIQQNVPNTSGLGGWGRVR